MQTTKRKITVLHLLSFLDSLSLLLLLLCLLLCLILVVLKINITLNQITVSDRCQRFCFWDVRVMRFQSRPTNWPLLTIESPVAQVVRASD